jgi:phage terminase large subunit-like protein
MVIYSNGYLEDYYKQVMDGTIIAGHEMKLELSKLMEEMQDDRYIYDTHDADLRMDFMEHCVKLTKSPFYGKPMKLMLWQKAFISALYGFKMADGDYALQNDFANKYRHYIDRFRKTILLIARKNTKSETCSGLALTELITGNDGSDIVCSSNDDNQANILYVAIDTMRLMIDPKQQDTWKNQQWIKCKINGSKVFKLSDRTRNKEGRNIDFAIVDEVHEMKDNTIIKSIEQSQSLKPNPKLILITTEGFVNGGFLDEELIKARKILNGEDDSISAERYLPWLYTQDSEQEVWQDPSSWQKSNPTLGIVKRWDYLQEQVDAARKSKADRMFTLSKDFNFKVSNSEAWIMGEMLDYSRVYNIADFRNTIALGGVDLAETTDMCSAKILMLKPDDGTKYIHSMYWIPESKLKASDDKESGAKYEEWARQGLIRIHEGNEVDVTAVADWFYELYKDYGIRIYKCGYDQRFAKDFLKRMDDYGYDTEMIYQNRFVLSSPMRLVEADIRDQAIAYNDNPIDKWCLLNTSVQVWDTGHILPVKIKGQAARRIDGTLSLIMAYEMFRRYRTDLLSAVR